MGNKICEFCANHANLIFTSLLCILLSNVQFPLSSAKEMPTIMKILNNPKPEDGYDSLRSFARDISTGVLNGKQLYNTFIALTSSLFSFQLPSTTDSEDDVVKIANQVIFGMFGFLTSVLVFALPVLLTGQRFNPNARNNQDDGILSTILKMEPLAGLINKGVHKQIGLEPEKCLQKTICEAPQKIKIMECWHSLFKYFTHPLQVIKNLDHLLRFKKLPMSEDTQKQDVVKSITASLTYLTWESTYWTGINTTTRLQQ